MSKRCGFDNEDCSNSYSSVIRDMCPAHYAKFKRYGDPEKKVRKLSPKVTVTCPCGSEFETTQRLLDEGRGKRCSKKCQYEYATRPSGLSYEIKQENRAWFKEGHETWNTGTKGLMPEPRNKGVKGLRLSPDTEFKPGQEPWNKGISGVMPAGEEHHAWKGDDVGYRGLHSWVRKHLDKTGSCQHCEQETKTHWANKSHEYRREASDWLELCPKCHAVYDSGEARGAIARNFPGWRP